MKSTTAQSLNKMQQGEFKILLQDSSLSDGHQGDITFFSFCYKGHYLLVRIALTRFLEGAICNKSPLVQVIARTCFTNRD